METYKGLVIPKSNHVRGGKNTACVENPECSTIDCIDCLFSIKNKSLFEQWNNIQPTQNEILNDLAESTDSQNKAILSYLRAGNTINSESIPEHIKCCRLASRIHDIKKIISDKEEIVSYWVKIYGRNFKEYKLIK